VLRRTAPGGPLEWTDRAAEALVMNHLAEHGFPVPRVRWVADDDSELGTPYLVMDLAPGEPAASAADRQELAEDLARWLARLHAATLTSPGTGDADGDAGAAVRADLDRWRVNLRERAAEPWPLVDALLDELEARLPEAVAGSPAQLIWGDAGLHNALARDGRISALFDWELAHTGHPLEDLASAVWLELDGPVDVDAMVAAYETASGAPVDRGSLDTFVAAVCVTRSIMILGAGSAFAHGRTSTPSLAGLALDLPVHQLGRAAHLLGWDPVEPSDPPVPSAAGGQGPRPDGPELDRGIARHLAEQVLPQVEDRHTRRGLRTAVALLETSARRAELDGWYRARVLARAQAAVRLPDGDLSARRRLLLEDLADRAALLAPLAALYRPTRNHHAGGPR
jgi:aminoglycoside phosphotransferase (APT) family kinase protein